MKRFMRIMIGLCLLVGSAVAVYADDTAVAEIIVTANSACTVQLDGISENTQGYSEKKELTDQVSFFVTYDEPGTYEYELKQVKSDTSEIYDSVVYQVFVNAIYESDVMKTVVTGGIKGTEEKPEQFKFEKKVEPAPEESEQSTEPAARITETADENESIQTGDETNLYFWINMLLISGGALLLLFAVTSIEKKREKKSM